MAKSKRIKESKKDNLEGLTDKQKNIVRLREKLNKPNPDDVKVFTKYKILTYFMNIICPPYALYRIWCKKSTFNLNERIVQTAVCVIYTAVLINLLLGGQA